MKGRTLQIIFLSIILLYIQINIFTTTRAETIKEQKNYFIVNTTGAEDYKTIQEAINSVPEDSTIYVTIGIYQETINIKTRIKLVGEDKDKTIINPISEKNKYAINLEAPGVIISNLNITNGALGIYTTAVQITAPETRMSDCNIHDTPIGIAVWTSYNIIENCRFWGCKDEGIALIGSQYSKCDNNIITNCVFYNNCDGIELQYSSNNIISYCRFYQNSHIGIDAIASSNNGNIIQNCEIHNNKVNGIYLSSSSNNKIKDCLISNNGDENIVITKNSYNNEIINTEPISSYKNNNLRERIFDRLSRIKTLIRVLANF